MRGRALASLVAVLIAVAGPAAAAEDASATAHQAVADFVEAVTSADTARLEAVLAPEYQIMRADGTGYARDDYIDHGLPQIDPDFDWQLEELVATTAGDLMVVRYHLVLQATVDGEAMARRAPRLTVFRRDGERWLVSAHGNFAATN